MSLADIGTNLEGALTSGNPLTVGADLLKAWGNEGALAANAGSTVAKAATGKTFGDYTLIAVGIVLAIGALLISQKANVVQVAKTAAA